MNWHRMTDPRCLAHSVLSTVERWSHSLADRVDPPLRHIERNPAYHIEVRDGRRYVYDDEHGTFLASFPDKRTKR